MRRTDFAINVALGAALGGVCAFFALRSPDLGVQIVLWVMATGGASFGALNLWRLGVATFAPYRRRGPTVKEIEEAMTSARQSGPGKGWDA
jgi:hypothetical protein